MEDNATISFYKQLIDVCKEEFGHMIIETLLNHENDKVSLLLLFELQSNDFIKYPSFWNETIETKESEHKKTALHVYFFEKNIAHFYLWGTTEQLLNKEAHYYQDAAPELYSEHIFTLSIQEPEELLEIVDFLESYSIHGFGDKEVNFGHSDVGFNKVFESVFLYVPEFSENIARLDSLKTQMDITTFERSMSGESYNNVIDQVNENEESWDELIKRHSDYEQKTRNFLNEHKKDFVELAEKTSVGLKAGDFLVQINDLSKISFFKHNRIIEKRQREYCDPAASEDYSVYIVFRPSNNVSYSFLMDYIHNTAEGIKLIRDCISTLPTPEKIRFIPSINNQLLFAIIKNIYRYKMIEALKHLINRVDYCDVALSNISERHKLLDDILYSQ